MPPASASETQAKDTIWAEALQATAALGRQSSSEADVLRALSEALRRLKMRGTAMLLDADGRLQVRSLSISQSVLSALGRLSQTEVIGYRFDPAKVTLLDRALRSRGPVFADSNRELARQMAPPSLQAVVPQIQGLIGDSPVIAAPLLLDEGPIGVLTVSSSWLSEQDEPKVSALCDHLAAAIEGVRSRAEILWALDRERLRNQVAEALASSLDIRDTIHRVIELAVQLTVADAGGLILVDGAGHQDGHPFLVGLPDDPVNRPVRGESGVIWRVIRSRSPLVIDDYASDPDANPGFVQAGIQTYLGVPLLAGDEVIGAMGLFGLTADKRFSREQVERAESIARLAALSVKNARLFQEVQQRAQESQALIRTATSVTASLDLVTVLGMIADQARELLGADGSRIHLLDPERNVLKVVVAHDTYPEELRRLELEPGTGLAGWVMQTGEPLLTNDPSSDPRGVQVPGTPEDEPECLLMAPLAVRQRTAGVMVVVRNGRDRPFLPRQLEVLTAFASQAAVAIENAHLFGQIQAQATRLEAEVIERTRDLAISEARYRALVELSIAGIQQIDRDGRIVYANRVVADMLEMSPEDLIGRTLLEVVPPEVQPHPHDVILRHLSGERPNREVLEMEFPTRSGRLVPMLLGISLITDDRNEPQGLTVLMLDVSERKELEAALREERDRIGTILNNIGDAVFVTSPDGIIEFVNPAWERLNGYTAAEAVGRPASLLNSGESPPELFSDLWSAVAAGETWRGDLVNRRKDGTTYDTALTATPLTDPSGAVSSIVSVLYDISAAKELDRLKSQFVSDVSHELRTPLTNIRLYLDLLRGTSDRTKVERYLDTLSRESDRLAFLIDDLLSLSRLDAGAVSPDMRPVDINRLLGSLVDDRRALATKRGLELSLEWDTSLPPARGDERLLSQVFTNLLTNAMNYTPDQGQITLRTRHVRNEEGAWVAAEVSDTGPGIPPEEQPMIFRRFFRGRASRATGAAGTGLGLAICREIVDLHDGRITLESEGIPAQGTRFTVWLPSAQGE
ncbi:MAG TPA: GAF domain-containing protein [Anaerolineales bacterium]|nr:GAF domain-containing protein [Anaerolineales bacterium]